MKKSGQRSVKYHIKRKRQDQRRKSMRRITFSILGVVFLSTILAAAFFLGAERDAVVNQEKISSPTRKVAAKRKSEAVVYHVMEEYPNEEEEEKVGFGLEDLIEKTRTKKTSPKIDANVATRKPLLVLIIDDVSYPAQLRKIRSLPYHITPSIFPPSKMNRHSPQIAKGLKHYMVHLPMQSSNAKMNAFTKTMKIGDDRQKIAARIHEIRRLFPTAKFVNNHTGSVFTSNYRAMRRAYIELKRNGFIFVDSRTTGKSTVRKISKIYRDPYLGRDVFIDNVQRTSAILKQLQKAVKIARKRGYAIAIGHPHRATMDALRHAGKVLSGVEVVYIDEFYKRYYGRH